MSVVQGPADEDAAGQGVMTSRQNTGPRAHNLIREEGKDMTGYLYRKMTPFIPQAGKKPNTCYCGVIMVSIERGHDHHDAYPHIRRIMTSRWAGRRQIVHRRSTFISHLALDLSK